MGSTFLDEQFWPLDLEHLIKSLARWVRWRYLFGLNSDDFTTYFIASSLVSSDPPTLSNTVWWMSRTKRALEKYVVVSRLEARGLLGETEYLWRYELTDCGKIIYANMPVITNPIASYSTFSIYESTTSLPL